MSRVRQRTSATGSRFHHGTLLPDPALANAVDRTVSTLDGALLATRAMALPA